jgi:hypothetical protein
MICAALISACLIPAWILPHGESSLSGSGFSKTFPNTAYIITDMLTRPAVMQFFVQGAWGVIRKSPHHHPTREQEKKG